MEGLQILYPAGLLHNSSNDKYHPVFFRISPRPSDDCEKDSFIRFRSAKHHTDGFNSKKAALTFLAQQTKWKDTGIVWEWDGKDIPTTTEDFRIDDFLATS